MAQYPKENLYKVLNVTRDADSSAIEKGYESIFNRYRNDRPENLMHVKRKFSQKGYESID